MNPYELLNPDGTPSGVLVCAACRAAWPSGFKDAAERCCLCHECGGPLDRPGPAAGHAHDACRRRARDERDAKRLTEAELVPDWPGWVYYGGDRFFRSIADLAEHLECCGVPEAEWPERVHVCVERPFRGLDVDDLIQAVTEDSYEGAADDLRGVAELTAAVKAFNAANRGLVSYEPDCSRAVMVPRPDRHEEDAE